MNIKQSTNDDASAQKLNETIMKEIDIRVQTSVIKKFAIIDDKIDKVLELINKLEQTTCTELNEIKSLLYQIRNESLKPHRTLDALSVASQSLDQSNESQLDKSSASKPSLPLTSSETPLSSSILATEQSKPSSISVASTKETRRQNVDNLSTLFATLNSIVAQLETPCDGESLKSYVPIQLFFAVMNVSVKGKKNHEIVTDIDTNTISELKKVIDSEILSFRRLVLKLKELCGLSYPRQQLFAVAYILAWWKTNFYVSQFFSYDNFVRAVANVTSFIRHSCSNPDTFPQEEYNKMAREWKCPLFDSDIVAKAEDKDIMLMLLKMVPYGKQILELDHGQSAQNEYVAQTKAVLKFVYDHEQNLEEMKSFFIKKELQDYLTKFIVPEMKENDTFLIKEFANLRYLSLKAVEECVETFERNISLFKKVYVPKFNVPNVSNIRPTLTFHRSRPNPSRGWNEAKSSRKWNGANSSRKWNGQNSNRECNGRY